MMTFVKRFILLDFGMFLAAILNLGNNGVTLTPNANRNGIIHIHKPIYGE